MPRLCSNCGCEISDSAHVCASCGREFSVSKEDTTNLLADRYEVLCTIKSGAMGCVYKARDTHLNTIVALKKMQGPHTKPEDLTYAEQRFLEEARILSHLHHSGLPKVTDFFSTLDPDTDKPVYYLVMTYIDGNDLETIIHEKKGEPLPIEESLDYFCQLLEIFTYLHAQALPIVYRDMNPRNIMVQNGKVFLVDFGIARIFTREKRGTAIGTPGYAAPEQYKGFASPRSDLYSLGVVMHYLLTGENPEDSSRSPFTFDSPKNINPKVPDYLEKIIVSMLDIVPDRRPESAQAVLKLLRSPSVVTVSPVKTWLRVAIMIFSVIAGFFVVSFFKTSHQRKSTEQKQGYIAVESRQTMTPTPYDAHSGMVSPTPSPLDTEQKPDSVTIMPQITVTPTSFVARERAVSPTPPPLVSERTPGYVAMQSQRTTMPTPYGARNGVVSPTLLPRDSEDRTVSSSIVSRGTIKFKPGFTPMTLPPPPPIDVERLNRESGITPLHEAANGGDYEKVELLLSQGSDVNFKDVNGTTPLHEAAGAGRYETAQILIKRGADVNARTNEGYTPLFGAIIYGHIETIELLISHRADVNAQAQGGTTPLSQAISGGRYEIAKMLISRGADVNTKSTNGRTPLHLAVFGNHYRIVELLISQGADVNAKDISGTTPLHLSIERKNDKIAELLRNHGAQE